MHRRDILQYGVAGAAALSGLSAQAQTQRWTPEQFKIEFAEAVKTNRYLTPLKGAVGDLKTQTLAIEGKLPEALKGRFVRNGPALMERAAQRYQHWFAGDGMVQQFTFDGKGVAHQGRFVQTQKFRKEQAAGRFLVPGFGTHIASSERVTGPDSMNTANTNAIEHGGRLLAMWEGGSAIDMDPLTLETRGPVVWKDGWGQMPFSAHPKLDPQGNLWNMGGGAQGFVTYQIGQNGRLVNAQSTKLPIDAKRAGGMIHDMAVTERFIVVPIPPVVVRWDLIAQGQIGADAMGMTPGEPLRIWVAPKADISKAKIFELPGEMVFHVGNAYEAVVDGGTGVVLNYIGGAGNDFLSGSAVNMMRGMPSDAGQSCLRTVRLNLASGRVKSHSFETQEEFPRLNPHFIGRAADWVLTSASWNGLPDPQGIQFHGIQLRNLEDGRLERFDYGPDIKPEEHIVVAKPGASKELDAWILGTAFDAKSQRTCVNVFEASRLADGPIARAWLPYWLPLGFHGNFTAA